MRPVKALSTTFLVTPALILQRGPQLPSSTSHGHYPHKTTLSLQQPQ